MPNANKFLMNIITVIVAVLFLCVQGLWAYPPECTSSLRPMSSAKSTAKQIKAAVSRGAKFSSVAFEEARQKLDAYIGNAMEGGRSQLHEFEIYDILRILGINVPQYTVIRDPQDIPTLPDARKLVLKIISPSLHKSDEMTADGTVKGVEMVSSEQAPQIIRRMFEIHGTEGVMVCPFIESASGPSELLLGFTDAYSGRLICFGEGGFYTDYRLDRAYRDYRLPFSARELIASTNIGKHFIYGRYRSKNLPLETEELESLIEMLAAFKRYYDDSGEYSVSGFDINPLLCQPDGRLFACDAKLEFTSREPALKAKPVERISKIFHPRSIAVIGAAGTLPYRVSANIGRLMDNLVDTFKGKIYFYLLPSYNTKEYRGIKFVGQVPDDCDLCVIFKSKADGIKVVEERLDKGNATILIAAGFGEIKEGAQLEQELRNVIEEANEKGCLVGPNTMGIITPDFDATFADKSAGIEASKESNIAFISQSGVFLSAGASSLALRNTKIHYGVSIGNAMDLKAADYLEYILEYEPQIKIVAMYLESSSGERLGYLINEARKKGVFVIIRKGGTTEEGEKAATSHTAGTAGKFEHFKAVLEQAGAVVFSDTDDYDLWVDTVYAASHFAAKGIPQGKRVFTFCSGGEDTVTTTDVIEASSKLEFPQPDKELGDFILGLNVLNAVKNPFDVTAAISAEKIMNLLEYLDLSETFDLIIFEYLRWLSGPGKDVELIRFVKERKSAKPLVFAIKDDSVAGKKLKDDLRQSGFLVFDTPQRCILALSAILKSGTAATKSLSVDGDNPTRLGLPLAESKASRLNCRKDTMVMEAVSTAA